MGTICCAAVEDSAAVVHQLHSNDDPTERAQSSQGVVVTEDILPPSYSERSPSYSERSSSKLSSQVAVKLPGRPPSGLERTGSSKLSNIATGNLYEGVVRKLSHGSAAKEPVSPLSPGSREPASPATSSERLFSRPSLHSLHSQSVATRATVPWNSCSRTLSGFSVILDSTAAGRWLPPQGIEEGPKRIPSDLSVMIPTRARLDDGACPPAPRRKANARAWS
eukprot:TRINITY_DN39278_c0_g1_i1.p1 TRINITY_DN39278_c0_g1~~TRINITY_DN39278_c0_g1_i1.p1  ORF type:complete len:244 (+),score=21.33 TRINITY_DN39278_c0_g1_i1:67-732(+)